MNMWNLRLIGKVHWIRSIVKYIFGLVYYDGRVTKIPFGPLKGMKWVSNRAHQFWMPLGMYEDETAKWLVESIHDGDVFLDIGANSGYFSLMGSKYVGGGRVIAFEPVPLNNRVVRGHIKENKINNIVLEELAVSNANGLAYFSVQENNANSHLSDVIISHANEVEDQLIEINTVRLDDYCVEKGIVPNVIKIDVEGAEKMVLEGAEDVINKFNAVWIISTHSSDLFEACKEQMIGYGYHVETLKGFHHELICKKIQ